MASTSFPQFLFFFIIFFFLSACGNLSTVAANREAPASLGDIGKYTTMVSLGTPASQFQAMVDVAGDYIWVQCDTKHRQFFDSSKSSTYQHIPCNKTVCKNLEDQICYSNQSCGYIIGMPDGMPDATGNYSTDALIIPTTSNGDVTVPTAMIACGSQDDNFMGRKAVRLGVGGLLGQIIRPFDSTFSHCFQRKQSINDDGDSHLRFGQDAAMLGNSTPVTWCSLGRKYLSRETISLEDISLGTQKLNFPPGTFVSRKKCGVVIDSGTAVTYLPELALETLVRETRVNTERSSIIPDDDFWPLCLKGTRAELANDNSETKFLPVTLHFQGGLDVVLNPLDLYVPIDDKTVCLLMSVTDDITALGTYALQDKNVWYGFSSPNDETVRIAPATC